jgi:SAM-dependent methyltransferase
MSASPFKPEHFQRMDEAPDAEFYSQPRFVVHIDEGAIEATRRVYQSLLPAGGRILDLMSSWRSHLPSNGGYSAVVGLGMNAAEMAANPQLTSYVVQDLNRDPRLPFDAGAFDAAVNTVSVQYLTQPLAVFSDVYRVLRPGAPYVVTFSNRCFPTKAVSIWRALNDEGHAELIAAYFRYSAPWVDIHALDRNPGAYDADPLYAVYARKSPASDPADPASAASAR